MPLLPRFWVRDNRQAFLKPPPIQTIFTPHRGRGVGGEAVGLLGSGPQTIVSINS